MPSQQISTLELGHRYLAFLDLERKLLAQELQSLSDGKIRVLTDRKVERFFEPAITRRANAESAEARAHRVLSAAGISLKPDHFLFD